MKNIIYSIIIITSILGLYSCEETISLELNNVTKQVVIEGVITDQPGPYFVKISQTGNFFESNDFGQVSGALVTISDNKGVADTLKESGAGIYSTTKIQGAIGNNYKLSVSLNGKNYSADALMQSPISLDSVRYSFSTETGPGTGGKKAGYNLHCYFNDPPNKRDFCLLKVFVNNIQNNSYYLYNGRLNTDQVIDYNRFRQRFNKNDTVRIELLTLDYPVFDYFSTLDKIMGSEGMRGIISTGTPANPNTNISSGALGYFAAYAVKSETVVLK